MIEQNNRQLHHHKRGRRHPEPGDKGTTVGSAVRNGRGKKPQRQRYERSCRHAVPPPMLRALLHLTGLYLPRVGFRMGQSLLLTAFPARRSISWFLISAMALPGIPSDTCGARKMLLSVPPFFTSIPSCSVSTATCWRPAVRYACRSADCSALVSITWRVSTARDCTSEFRCVRVHASAQRVPRLPR
jgi:hypothetical protein